MAPISSSSDISAIVSATKAQQGGKDLTDALLI